MKTNIPSGAWLWMWRIHFAIFVSFFVLALSAAVSYPGEGVALIQFDMFTLLMLFLGALFVGGSIAGEAGFLFQRPMSTQGFWRVLLVILAAFWVLGVTLAAIVNFYVAPVDGSFLNFRDWFEILISAGNLWAIWAYAYRSPHLWGASMSVEGVSP